MRHPSNIAYDRVRYKKRHLITVNLLFKLCNRGNLEIHSLYQPIGRQHRNNQAISLVRKCTNFVMKVQVLPPRVAPSLIARGVAPSRLLGHGTPRYSASRGGGCRARASRWRCVATAGGAGERATCWARRVAPSLASHGVASSWAPRRGTPGRSAGRGRGRAGTSRWWGVAAAGGTGGQVARRRPRVAPQPKGA